MSETKEAETTIGCLLKDWSESLTFAEQRIFWTCWDKAKKSGGIIRIKWLKKRGFIGGEKNLTAEEVAAFLKQVRVVKVSDGPVPAAAFPAFVRVEKSGFYDVLHAETSGDFEREAGL